MALQVTYLSDEAIEKDAEALIADFERTRGTRISAPIPVEDIIEKHLKIGIEFDDTHRLFDVPHSSSSFDPDILGAILFDQKRIVIDESLDPDVNPAKEGRYRYTLAHEAGHWRLHRGLFGQDPGQMSFLEPSGSRSVVCRTSQAKQRIEFQADRFASCLLMPRDLIVAAWVEAFPDRKKRLLEPLSPIDHPFVEIARLRKSAPSATPSEIEDAALNKFARPLAQQFMVSAIAMRIRLEQLGLLLRKAPSQPLLLDKP
jgi:hypothetical protein